MRKVLVVIGMAIVWFNGMAHAQEVAPPRAPKTTTSAIARKLTVGVDGAIQLPIGEFADLTGVGLGALLRGEYNLAPNLNGTVRIGYIYSLKKEVGISIDSVPVRVGAKVSIDNIPIWVGAKYFLNDIIYVGGELGLNLLSAKTKTESTVLRQSWSVSNSETYFGGNVGLGALIDQFDLRAQFLFLDLGNAGDTMAIMVNVGYNFL